MSDTVLVTGAGGFLGRALVSALAGRGLAVRALLGRPRPDRDRQAPPLATGSAASTAPGQTRAADSVRQGRCDLDDADALASWLADVDCVFHLAGPPSVADSFRAPDAFRTSHVGGSTAIAAAAGRAGVRRLVYASSAEVYGQPAHNPVAETAAPSTSPDCQPRSPYGAAKLDAERALSDARVECGFELVSLRLFSVYGPRPEPRSVVDALWQQALSAAAIRPFRLDPVRDFVFLDDVVRAFLAAADRALPRPNSIYNIGTGVGTSIRQLAETMRRVTGRQVPIELRPGGDRPSDRDIVALIADRGRAAADLGWQPSTDLATGLAQLPRP